MTMKELLKTLNCSTFLTDRLFGSYSNIKQLCCVMFSFAEDDIDLLNRFVLSGRARSNDLYGRERETQMKQICYE